MPYVVTTKRPIPSWPNHQDYLTESRRAVATLEEARQLVASRLPTDASVYDLGLPDGGTVGPLPDGSLIEVERVEWADPGPTGVLPSALLAAFNSRQSS